MVTLEQIADMLDTLDNTSEDIPMGFDMVHDYETADCTPHPCGTACCIGGWVQALNPETRGIPIENAVTKVAPDMSEGCAKDLCWNTPALSTEVTPQQGAQAIRNALKYDDPKWDEVL